MKFELKPLQGAGPLVFGMRQAEVRRLLPFHVVPFRRWREPSPSDHFDSLGVFAYYDERGLLESIEFGRPAQPALEGIDLLGIPFDRAKQLLRLRGGEIQDEGENVTSRSLGLALWALDATEDPTLPCESVMAAPAGYFDRPSND